MDPELIADNRLLTRLPRLILAAIVMGLVALGLAEIAEIYVPNLRAASLGVNMVAAIATYFGTAAVLGGVAPKEILAIVRRRKRE